MSNPLSAIMEAPGSNKSGSPLLLVNCLSEIEPGYNLDTNVTAPLGDIPINRI